MTRREPHLTDLTDLNEFLPPPTAQHQTSVLAEQLRLDAELALIRRDARRVGRLLTHIPMLSLTWFFVRVSFAALFATILYVLCWWLILAISAGSGYTLVMLLTEIIALASP